MSEHLAQPPQAKPAAPARRIIRALLMLTGLIILAIGVLWIPVGQFISRVRRAECRSHVKQIAVALQQYHDKHGSFPPAYTVGVGGEKLHSWRSLILPHLGYGELSAQIRWDEPWNSPHNKALSERSPEIYACPSAMETSKGRTNYFAIVGRTTVWPEQHSVSIDRITDGTSNTILLLEANIAGVNWMQPQDVSPDQAVDWFQ